MKTFAYAAFAAAALCATSAHADTWSGPSVGVQGGWTHNSVNDPTTAVGPTDLHANKDSGTVGAFVGYDYKLAPRVVVGAQAELNFPFSGRITDGATTIQPKRSIDLSVRAGYLVDPSTLLYARGGYVNQREHTYTDATVPAYYGRGNQNGWMLGAGVERAITPNVTGRLEYRYTDLADGHGYPESGKWDRHQVLAGVAYHF